MSELRVSSIRTRTGTPPKAPDGISVSGVATATTFNGNLTGNVTGNISGATGTFSGNVSIGGTLTYEEVSAVDSVGVITARGGIRVGAGQSISAVSGIVTYYGDGSKLSGVESGLFDFVASGTIANGQSVIVTSDGKVAGVVTTGIAQTNGTRAAFQGSGVSAGDIDAAYDTSAQKVVVAFRDNTNSSARNAQNAVITVNGTTVSWDSQEHNLMTQQSEYIGITYVPDQERTVSVWRDTAGGDRGYAYVVDVATNGTWTKASIDVEFAGSGTDIQYPGIGYVGNSKVVIAYRNDDDSNHGYAVVGTVTGDLSTPSISFGTPVKFASHNTMYPRVSYDASNDRVLITYKNNNNYATAIVGQVSGTSISFGTAKVINSSFSELPTGLYDPDTQQMLVAYRDGGNNNGRCVVGSINTSDNSFSHGSEVIFNAAGSDYVSVAYDTTANKAVIAFRHNDAELSVVEGTIGTQTATFSPRYGFGFDSIRIGATFDSVNEKVIIACQDGSDGNRGKVLAYQVGYTATNLTSENYIGIAGEAISNGATGKVTIATGINDGQTGLTTGQKYYVQNNGSLATSAGSPSVVAGTAISSTKIIVKG